MKRLILVAATLAASIGIAAVAVAAPGTTAATGTSTAQQYQPRLGIHFAEVGCHTWSLNGGPAGLRSTCGCGPASR
jgi:hypothetical protein